MYQNVWICIFMQKTNKHTTSYHAYIRVFREKRIMDIKFELLKVKLRYHPILCKVGNIHSGIWIVFDVLEITVLFFFYFILTVGAVFLCFGWISISLGELFLIWVPQTWSGSLWCQKWDSSAEAQWKAGPLRSGGQSAQIHPKRATIPNEHNSALVCPSTQSFFIVTEDSINN